MARENIIIVIYSVLRATSTSGRKNNFIFISTSEINIALGVRTREPDIFDSIIKQVYLVPTHVYTRGRFTNSSNVDFRMPMVFPTNRLQSLQVPVWKRDHRCRVLI